MSKTKVIFLLYMYGMLF